MFCRNCGAQIPDDSRFCPTCGTPMAAAPSPQGYAQPQVSQPVYQQPAYQQPVYQQPMQQPVYQQPVYGQPMGGPAYATGQMIKEAGKYTRYMGDKAIGVVTGQGSLIVYDDRLEFYKTSGSQAGFALNPIVGLAMQHADKKKHPVDTYFYRELKGVRNGKYSGLIPTLILDQSNGKSVSFAKAAGGMDPKELADLIRPYLPR